MKRLSGWDAFLLYSETPNVHMHTLKIAVIDLAGLGDRLRLPDGWSYRARVLDDELRIDTSTEAAQVLQDDLTNSYSWVR